MKKFVIGICDDNEEIVYSLHEQINTCTKKISNIEWTISDYKSARRLLEDIAEIDIVFLDIEMPEMDGIVVGNKIGKLNPNCKIILASSRIDRFKDAFHINTFRFITKPFSDEEITEALDAILKTYNDEQDIEVFLNRNKFNINQRDVSIIRAYNGYVEIMAGRNVFRKDISMLGLYSQLNANIFCQVNRQIIVGLGFVSEYRKREVIVNGKKYKITSRRQSDFINKYIQYDLKYRR